MKAVCLACGASKWGALAACRSCGARPATPEDEARHALASEEHLDDAALDELQRVVLAGGQPAFDPERVRELAAEYAAVSHAPVWFALLVAGGPVAAILGLGVGLWLLSGLLAGAGGP